MVKNSPLRNSHSNMSLRAKAEEQLSTPPRPLPQAIATGNVMPPSPFADLPNHVRFPWNLSSQGPEQMSRRAVSAQPALVEKRPIENNDRPTFEELLRQRLVDAKEQLRAADASALNDNYIWHLKTEIERLEAKLAEESKAGIFTKPEDYTKPFCDFLTENPTVFHAVDYFSKKLTDRGFEKVVNQPLSPSISGILLTVSSCLSDRSGLFI